MRFFDLNYSMLQGKSEMVVSRFPAGMVTVRVSMQYFTTQDFVPSDTLSLWMVTCFSHPLSHFISTV